MVMKNSPLLILVTGPNGAGKSTLVLELFANSEMRLIHKAKAQGYQIMLHFVSLESKALSMARIKMRFAKVGHDIPLADVHRRFERCYANIHKAQPLADTFFYYVNSCLYRTPLLITQDMLLRYEVDFY